MKMLPDVQYELRPGVIEFRWGHPDLALLPTTSMAQAAARALTQGGIAALSYGAEQGPGTLIAQVCAWLGRHEGTAPAAEQVYITAGVSQALDLLCTLWTQPRDIALVESPVYHLALRIFRDHGLDLRPVAADEQGVIPDALAAALANLHRQGRQPRFFYTVPTFGNPTAAVLPLGRRQAIAALAQKADLLILEDDVYRRLWYDAPPPPPLAALAPANVVRLGSFSKVLAPGLRLGWLVAPAEIVRRCAGAGLNDSGGGVSHFTAHVVAAFMELGWLDPHIEELRAVYRQRRDALLAALAAELPPGCRCQTPAGGFFAWVRLPEGCDSAALLPAAEAAGLSYVPGARFFADGSGARYLRLAFSLLAPEELAEGARRLGRVLS